MALLELRDITKAYGAGAQRVDALRGVSMAVEAGEMVSLVGPSGSGKSTLLAIIGGLLTPSSGEMLVGGRDVTRLTARERSRYRRDQVGFVFQASNLVPFLTARENLLLVGEFGGADRAALRERADNLLRELGLTEAAGQPGNRLSGGQRQRVAIARALMRNPSLILVDEPTASLDTKRGAQVVEALRDEVHGRHKACLMVTHDLEMAARADRIFEIRDGLLHPHEAVA
ncbi:MAG: ABC transporter ATP-binding protein [Dehalococcoidia bacterium]|nr:MAG: ABC transporter ATP-binding protein [Dehalococcoidia bacterium]